MFAPAFRLLSDKENTHIPVLRSTQTKTRLPGIGRAPRSNTTIKQHKNKPYTRISSGSVQRAKAKATGSVVHTESGKEVKGKRPTSLNLAKDTKKEKVVTAKIPLRLPLPSFPPITLDIQGLEGVPAQYILPKLKSHLPSLLIVSSLYRPYQTSPLTESPTNQPRLTSSHPKGMRFGIPSLIDETLSTEEKEKMLAKIKGREPDVCLGVMGKGKGDGEKIRLIPVNQLVYATQCAYWPTLSSQPEISSIASIPATENIPTHLETISEDPDTDPETSVSSDSSFSSTSSTSTITPRPHTKHLPIIPLPLPSPSTFHLIHHALHLPSRPFLPELLNLPSTSVTGLEGLSNPQLMERLEVIHGVWGNLCTLGISDEKIWREMGQAWALVVGVLGGRVKGGKMDVE